MKLHETGFFRISARLRRVFGGMAAGAFALIWWGMLYPELCFPEDTYEIVSGSADWDAAWNKNKSHAADEYPDGEALPEGIGDDDCRGLLYADGEQVVVKSRFLEWIREYKMK